MADVEICEESHPEHPEVLCDKPVPCYHLHASRKYPEHSPWDNDAVPPSRVSSGGARARMGEMATRAKGARKTGAADPAEVLKSRRVDRSEWGQEPPSAQWVEDTLRTFEEFLRGRGESFTTAEDFWPLIDTPGDMREMVHVVRRALRLEWIQEVGAKRLSGTYRTRNGHEFQMNKLVPIYESRI